MADGMVEGKVALVVGGGLGIGRETAVLLAKEGAEAVCVVDVDADTAAETAAMVEAAGAGGLAVAADVSVEADVRAARDRVVSEFGRIDCAFNNAGILGAWKPIHEYPVDEFDRVVAVNLRGVFLCMQVEIEQMLAQGGGAIVNTSSGAGVLGVRGLGGYGASKHGVVGLTRTAGVEYAEFGIRVNVIVPGAVETTFGRTMSGQSPWMTEKYGDRVFAETIGRAQPEQIAEAAVWLCSDRANFVAGAIVPVDNGFSAQ